MDTGGALQLYVYVAEALSFTRLHHYLLIHHNFRVKVEVEY